MRKIVHPYDFVNAVLVEAPKTNIHVIKYGDHWPQMADPLWRAEVEHIFNRYHKNKFTKLYFSAPDQLDENWLFTATKNQEAWSNLNADNLHKVAVEMPPQDSDIRPWSKRHGILFTLAVVVFALGTCVLFYMLFYISLGGGQ